MSNFNKMFNSTTNTGRANVAKATYGTIALLYIVHRLRRRYKSKAACPDCGCPNCPSGNNESVEAAPPVDGSAKNDAACDPEVWKQAIYGDKPDANNGVKDAQEAKNVSYKIEKGVDLKIVNLGNSERK